MKWAYMNINDIKRTYEIEGRDAALEAYRKAIEECKGQEETLADLAFLAADFAHSEALSLLFENGVSPLITDKYAYNLLHYLARQQESKYHRKPKGAVAAATALLLDNKVSALRKDENEKMCPYHYAARNGLAEMVETMAERSTKLNMTDKDGNTGIHIAAEYARDAIKNIDYKKRDMENARAKYEKEIAKLKANNTSDEEIAEYVSKWIKTTPEKAQGDYEAAIQNVEEFFRVVKAFAEGGVDKDEKNSYDKTALNFAIESDAKKIAAFLSGTLSDESDAAAVAAGGMTLHQAAEKGDAAAIKAIAGTGADVNALKDAAEHKFGGCTALTVACSFLQEGAVEALLATGADPSFKDGNGRTAVSYIVNGLEATLHTGVFEEKRIPKIVKNLVSAGMDINQAVDDNGNTLLILACVSSRGTGYNRYTLKGVVIEEAMKLGANLNLANRFGETALMHACTKDFDIMENVQLQMLEQGADVSAANNNGDTAMHYAARNNDKNGAKSLCDMLLEFGADASAVNNAGKTALDIATEMDNESLVKLLLSKM